MPNPVLELIKQLNDQPEFQAIMKEMVRNRPIVPSYKPCKTEADEQMLLARIKYESGRMDGFDFLYRRLTGIAP